MPPYIVIVLMDIHSGRISTIKGGPNKLTCQYSGVLTTPPGTCFTASFHNFFYREIKIKMW